MQAPAERFLIEQIIMYLQSRSKASLIVNIGAGKSLVVERALALAGCQYQEDRVDVLDSAVNDPHLRKVFVAPMEAMLSIESRVYELAFANFVLEHVAQISAAAREVYRILKPGGQFVLSTPNPAAPEFFISKRTPHWFHQFIKGAGEGHEAHETHYSYNTIDELITIFKKAGFKLVLARYYPFSFGYLYRFSFIKWFSWLYDHLVGVLKWKRLMGNVGLVFEKVIV